MTDFESRLRAAMASAAGPAPAGLLDGIRQRRRRHRRHVATTAGSVVLAAAIAVPLAALPPSGTGTAGGHSGVSGLGGQHLPAVRPSALPGTVLRDCSSAEGGTVGSNWKARSVHAGPVWFIYEQPPAGARTGGHLTTGPVTNSAFAIAVSNGHTAVITAGSATHARFRFLARFNAANTPSTMSEGAPGLTLEGCPAGPGGTDIPAGYAAGLTMFWEGYVTDLRGCIPVVVRDLPDGTAVHATIAGPGCSR